MMCVPLLGLDGEPMGVINLDTQNVLSRFNKDDSICCWRSPGRRRFRTKAPAC